MSINENLTLKSFLFCSIVSYFISYLSFIFIEKPFRNRAKISGKNFLIIIFSVLLIIISTSFLIITNKDLLESSQKQKMKYLHLYFPEFNTYHKILTKLLLIKKQKSTL